MPPGAPTDGGGATTFEPRDAPLPFRIPLGLPAAEFGFTEGGGGTTLAARECARPLTVSEVAEGGGGTTSLGPKIFPIMLLMNDPLLDCDGGGGTTLLPASGMLPEANRRMSRDKSAEGGGGTTEGAGNIAFEGRDLALSGAETGGGITAPSMLCRGAVVI